MSSPTLPAVERSTHLVRPTNATSPQLLVATDGSSSADGAVCLGALLARRQDLDMEVLTVLSGSNATLEAASDAEQRIRRQLETVGATQDDHRIEVRSGPAARTIAGVAREHGAGLIVMGVRRRGLRAWLPGARTLTQLLPIGDTPILSVPPSTRALPSRLLIAMDFSMPSIHAARAAVEIIGGFSRIDIVHVEPFDSAPGFERIRWQESSDIGVGGAFDRLLRGLPLVPTQLVETWTLAGDPSSELLRFAERSGCDLIAAGGRDQGILERVRQRSVTRDLLRSVNCPLLIAPRRLAPVWRSPKPDTKAAARRELLRFQAARLHRLPPDVFREW